MFSPSLDQLEQPKVDLQAIQPIVSSLVRLVMQASVTINKFSLTPHLYGTILLQEIYHWMMTGRAKYVSDDLPIYFLGFQRARV